MATQKLNSLSIPTLHNTSEIHAPASLSALTSKAQIDSLTSSLRPLNKTAPALGCIKNPTNNHDNATKNKNTVKFDESINLLDLQQQISSLPDIQIEKINDDNEKIEIHVNDDNEDIDFQSSHEIGEDLKYNLDCDKNEREFAKDVNNDEKDNHMDYTVNTQGDEYLDLSTPSAREHKINEKIYKTSCLPLSFYGNNLRLSTIENNLHKSIALGDITAVEKIINDIAISGALVSDTILQQDTHGRNAIHIAAAVRIDNRIEISIMRCLLESRLTELKQDKKLALQQLQEDRKRCLLELHKYSISKSSIDITNNTVLDGISSNNMLAIEKWFENEVSKIYRKYEFQKESWWLQCVTSLDHKNMTPIHYCCNSGSEAMLEYVLETNSIFGNFNTTTSLERNRKSKSLLLQNKTNVNGERENAISDKAGQRQTIDESTKNLITSWFSSHSIYNTMNGEEIIAVDSNILNQTTVKSINSYSFNFKSRIHELSMDQRIPLPQSQPSSRNKPQVDYDIIIPWLLRNIVKSASRIGKKLGASYMEILREVIDIIDLSCSDVLLPFEVKDMLGHFGIMVTKDIIKELCLVYSASLDDIATKWADISDRCGYDVKNNMKSDNRKFDEEDMYGDGNHKSEEKGTYSRPDRYKNYSDEKQSERKESKYDAKTESKSDDKKSSSNKVEYDEEDENCGLNVVKFLDDITSGHGLKSLYTDNKSTDKHSDKTDNLDVTLSEPNGERVTIPGVVTIPIIQKIRRNVVNMSDDNGFTPLIVASALGKLEHLSILLRCGGDISMTTSDGNSALSVAKNVATTSMLQKRLMKWLDKSKSSIITKGLLGESGTMSTHLSTDSNSNKWGGTRSDNSLSKSWESKYTHVSVNLPSEKIHNACASDVALLYHQLQILEKNRYRFCKNSLSWAVEAGLVDCVEQLLQLGSSPNATDVTGQTALHICMSLSSQVGMGDHCDLSQLEEYTTALMSLRSVAEELLKSGAKINAVTVSGRTPLHEMFCKGSDIIYDTCMTESREKTSLRRSLDKVKSLLVRSLLQWGANPMIVDRHGYSALHYCARENMYDAMVEILKNTPSLDINVCSSRGRTPLHVACMSSSAEVATLLCKWDADLKYGILYCQDKSGKLPQDLLGVGIDAISLLTLWKACRSGMPDKVNQLLQSQKSDSSALSKWEEVDHKSISGNPDPHVVTRIDDARQLLSKLNDNSSYELWMLSGVDAKTRINKWSPLHSCIIGWAEWSASYSKNLCAVKFTKRQSKSTPKTVILPNNGTSDKLRIERRKLSEKKTVSNHSIVLSILIQNFAYPDSVDIKQRTPLMYAAAANLVEAVNLLLTAKSKINQVDVDGNSALHYAYAFGSLMAASVLEANGANTSAYNAKDKRPFDIVGISDAVHSLYV